VLEDVFQYGDNVSATSGGRIKNLNQVKSVVNVQGLFAHYETDQLNGTSVCLHSSIGMFYNFKIKNKIS